MAYGTNAPWGLKPFRYANGSPWLGTQNAYPIASGYATAMYTNDPVTTLADGTVGIAVAGAASRGIFLGCQYTQTDGTIKFMPYWTASTTVKTGTVPLAFVEDDPNLVFDMQESNGAGAAGTPFTLADRNINVNFAVGTGSTGTGLSGASLDNTTEAVTATLNLKIIDLTPVPGNAVGNFANWLASWNNHQFKGGTGTAGV